MSLVNSLFGTTGVTGGQTLTTNNAAQGMQNAYNQPMTANAIHPGPLVSKQRDVRRLSASTSFTVTEAHNGYVVSTSDAESYVENRYIATTMEEVKDLVASILVQRKLAE
jgi:hypothetical protein